MLVNQIVSLNKNKIFKELKIRTLFVLIKDRTITTDLGITKETKDKTNNKTKDSKTLKDRVKIFLKEDQIFKIDTTKISIRIKTRETTTKTKITKDMVTTTTTIKIDSSNTFKNNSSSQNSQVCKAIKVPKFKTNNPRVLPNILFSKKLSLTFTI